MASILSMNDDCLNIIVSSLHDPRSFYSFALTCKRFLQATKNTRNVLHSCLLRTKAEYYIKRYIVDICRGQKSNFDRHDEYSRLRYLLKDAVRLTTTKGLLTYAKVVDVWQRNGAVAAKLFTWIREQEYSEEDDSPMEPTCSMIKGRVTLHLPSCKKSMKIVTFYRLRDNDHNYVDKLSIHVICGDLDVKSEGFAPRYSPEDYMYWEDEEVSNAVEPMKPVIELLQNELGDTVPPITGHFFIWLCYFFPDKKTLLEENRLNFNETVRNTKPSPNAFQSALHLFRQEWQEHEAKFQSVVSDWKNKEEQEPMYSKAMLETIDLLVRRSETKVLKWLSGVIVRYYLIALDDLLKSLPKQLLLALVLRTSLEAINYSLGLNADTYKEGRVLFNCLGSKVMNVSGGMHGEGAIFPIWDELDLEFTLPDGRELKLRTEPVNYSSRERPTAIGQLSPVTELLQQGINQRMQGEKHIPKINNLFTAVYFLQTFEFTGEIYTFLGDFEYEDLFERESDEQSTSEESDS